ncbi:hypothetical protein [Clostridium minihomine]|uniref:hypothetical protein n=1 Tax=Clostridium minihomine TaxID=2045012 RepID=UPI000C771601|nr:hypothetical protein [Clostridium minihomine]
MKTTENYGLKKPDYEDGADINVINENMDAIDAGMVAHASDEKLHVTQQDRELWNQGMMSTYLHKKTGKVHELTGQGNIIEFLATASIAEGDTWTVNGQPVTAKLQNGEPLPADLFKAGNWVTGVRLSDDGTKLTFTASGSKNKSLIFKVGKGNGEMSYDGTAAKSVEIPQVQISSSAPSYTLSSGILYGVY